jgi:murein L,D-transpeptidase YcbB/YkuD
MMRGMPLRSTAVVVLLVFSSCKLAHRKEDPRWALARQIETLVALWLPDIVPTGPDRTLLTNELAEFYDDREYLPAWHDASGLTSAGRRMIERLENAEEHGLRASDYAIDLPSGTDEDELEAQARLDIALSLETMRYVRDLHEGRVRPGDVGLRLEVTHHHPILSDELEKIVSASSLDEALDAFAPPYAAYWRLKKALARYRALAKSDEWRRLPDDRALEPNDTYADVALLRHRLQQTGDLTETPESSGDRYDEALVEAVKRFQTRHSINADGVIGKRTFDALNTPWSTRVAQLVASMERWRWVSEPLSGSMILINIPEFILRGIEIDGNEQRTTFSSRVIVGQHYADLRTPLFSGVLEYLDFHPYWNVPMSIIRKEMSDEIQEPGYLAQHGYQIVRDTSLEAEPLPETPSNIASVLAGTLRLRQKPGPGNALGPVKFVFPNDYSVFLHSTPARYLFRKDERAFSHGCIRVEDAIDLAEWVLRGQDGWDRKRINEALAKKVTTRVSIERPISVHILYLTAYVSEETGDVHFGHDVYGLDAELQRALGLSP